jgi:hypothetical protein
MDGPSDPLTGAVPHRDEVLAEFAALRQEIEARSESHQNIFVFQLTTAGALFGFALSDPARILLLLIVPMSSYLLLTRSVVQVTSIAVIGEYIRDEIEPKAPGLGWERYWRRVPYFFPFVRWAHPNIVLFCGTPALALAWTAYHLVRQPPTVGTLLLILTWCLDAAVTAYGVRVTWRSATRPFGPR